MKVIQENQQNQPEFNFSQVLIAWQKQYGRHTLPWQQTRDGYRIWLSEIMLQQTQVATVIPYYVRFLSRFPNVYVLAASSLEAVLSEWSGLGYYSRARHLHQCAQLVAEKYEGQFPSDPKELEKLPGIGRSTAAAIAVFSCGRRAAILDGNVIRVFSRIFGIHEYAGKKAVKDQLWHLAEALLPEKDIEIYTQGLMDLGATVCRRSNPFCEQCPFSSYCFAFMNGKTADLPVRRASKKIPEKQVVMMILTKKDKVLLKKRPATGIWGGLFSLPELTNTISAMPVQIEKTVSFWGSFKKYEVLEPLVHTFTHFKLHITPVWVQLIKSNNAKTEGQYIWEKLTDIETLPLPSPVKKLLERAREMVFDKRGK